MDLIREAEAAAILGLTRAAMTARRHRGAGPPYYRNGRTVRYERGELESFLRQGRVDPEASHE